MNIIKAGAYEGNGKLPFLARSIAATAFAQGQISTLTIQTFTSAITVTAIGAFTTPLNAPLIKLYTGSHFQRLSTPITVANSLVGVHPCFVTALQFPA